jgi:hypothetical protein
MESFFFGEVYKNEQLDSNSIYCAGLTGLFLPNAYINEMVLQICDIFVGKSVALIYLNSQHPWKTTKYIIEKIDLCSRAVLGPKTGLPKS